MKKERTHKTCSRCKTEKPVSEFWKDSGNTTGYNSQCKECRSQQTNKPKSKRCKHCDNYFHPYTSLDKFCSAACRIDNEKSQRSRNWNKKSTNSITGKSNPNFRNGLYTRKSKKTAKGEREFIKHSKSIKNQMIIDVGHLYCQHCDTSNSMRFETHHIVFRSEKPLHTNLHHPDNLIVVCISCHNDFHNKKGMRNQLVEERKLYKLFGEDVRNK